MSQYRQISLDIALVKELDFPALRKPETKSYFTARLGSAEIDRYPFHRWLCISKYRCASITFLHNQKCVEINTYEFINIQNRSNTLIYTAN